MTARCSDRYSPLSRVPTLLRNPARNSSNSTNNTGSSRNKPREYEDRSIDLSNRADRYSASIFPNITCIYRSYSTIRNRSRSPYALFSTDRIDSIQDEQYRIETCIDYRDRALFLSFSIYREQLIVRDQDPGTWISECARRNV